MISKTKMIDMFKANRFANKDVVNLESLQEIHYILFSDIYDFAGMIRNYDISTNGYKFEHYRFLIPSLNTLLINILLIKQSKMRLNYMQQ